MAWTHECPNKNCKKVSCNVFLSTSPINLLKGNCCCDQWQCVSITLGVSIIFLIVKIVFLSSLTFTKAFSLPKLHTDGKYMVKSTNKPGFSKISFIFLKAVSGSLSSLSSSNWKIILLSRGKYCEFFLWRSNPTRYWGEM